MDSHVEQTGAGTGDIHDLGRGIKIEDYIKACLILPFAARAPINPGNVFVPLGLRNWNIADLADDLLLNWRATEIRPATSACSY